MLISYYIVHTCKYISITYLLNSALFITYFWLKAWSTCIKILKSADRFSCVADKLLLWTTSLYVKASVVLWKSRFNDYFVSTRYSGNIFCINNKRSLFKLFQKIAKITILFWSKIQKITILFWLLVLVFSISLMQRKEH